MNVDLDIPGGKGLRLVGSLNVKVRPAPPAPATNKPADKPADNATKPADKPEEKPTEKPATPAGGTTP